MSELTRRLLILLVTVTAFVGLLLGWGVGLVIENGVGWTATGVFVAIAFLLVTILTAVWFGFGGRSEQEN